MRLCGAVNGFFVRHGHWPGVVRLEQAALLDLRCHLFEVPTWARVQQKLKFIVEPNARFVAEDDGGLTYSYGQDGFPREWPTPSVQTWLGVQPDRQQEVSELELFFETLRAGSEEPWWRYLKGEVRQGREPGRYLEDTLTVALGEDYRAAPRPQHFFSRGKRSCMDGCFGQIGVEEKVIRRTFQGIRDGAICRSLVWVMGTPEPAPARALGLCVTKGPPFAAILSAALFPVLRAIRAVGVDVAFVNGETGECWSQAIGEPEAPPPWLTAGSASTASTTELSAFSVSDLEEVSAIQRLPLTGKLFGAAKASFARFPDDDGLVYAEWPNEWQMLDIGLLLRGLGARAVMVRYSGAKQLKPAGFGVEHRVQTAMRERFGVVLDWGVSLEEQSR